MIHPQEAGKSKPVLVLEDINDKETEWGISFQDPNPEALYYFRMPDKETAFRLQKAIHEHAQQREQPWVRVEPGCEMPGNHQEVLIFTDPVISNAVYTDRNGRGLEFLNLAFHFGDTQPTHWKPLPPAPPKD